MPARFHELLEKPDADYLPYLIRVSVMASDRWPLPEILSCVRPEKLEDFLLAVGGQSVEFPSLHHLELIARDAKILQLYTEVRNRIKISKTAEAELGMKWAEIFERGRALESLTNEPA